MVTGASPSEWFDFLVRVNGREFHEAFLRRDGESRADLEVVIRDRQLGSFALHEEFLLEIQESDENNTYWRSISLPELKDAIGKQARSIIDSVLGYATSTSRGPSENLLSRTHHRIARITVEGDTSHVDRLHASLTESRIRYQIVGGLDSRGQARGHLTIAVSSLPGASMCLRLADFFESPESKYVLIDSRTGWKVRLLEGSSRCSSSR
jgi:hypothetical protein